MIDQDQSDFQFVKDDSDHSVGASEMLSKSSTQCSPFRGVKVVLGFIGLR